MTTEFKAQLFDELVGELDNDDTLSVKLGTLMYKSGLYYNILDEDSCFDTLESALRALGYDDVGPLECSHHT